MSVYRVLQFSDPHLFADRAGEMRGVCTYNTLKGTIDAAVQNHWPADAILVTGDIAQDESRDAYLVFRELFEPLGVPVFCLPGNHDAPEFMRELLVEKPFHYCGSAVLGNWLIPMLDSHEPDDAGGVIDSAELAALDQLLESQRDRHVLLSLHHHPISSGSAWLDTVPLRNAPELWDVVAKHEHVRCLLWGHVHQVHESRRDGRLLLSTPSTCRQFKPQLEEFALDTDRPPAYRWLDLHPDGTIVTDVQWCEAAATP